MIIMTKKQLFKKLISGKIIFKPNKKCDIKLFFKFRRIINNKPKYSVIKTTNAVKDKQLRKGHRARIRQRVLEEGIDNMSDRDLLELLLFYCYPYKDTRAIADEYLTKYSSLDAILSNTPKDLVNLGFTENSAVLLHLFYAVSIRNRKKKAFNKIKCNNPEHTRILCEDVLKYEKYEAVYLFCFDSKFKYLGYDIISRGTLTESPIYLRNVVEIALRLKARCIVLTHNHPSGVVDPSNADIEITNLIKNTMNPFEITLIDHIIIGKNDWYSFKKNKQL